MPLAFPADQLAKARAAITDSGESIAEWSRRNNLDLQMTGHVLRGSLKATRGEAFRVAVALGLRKRIAKKRISPKTWDGVERRNLNRCATDCTGHTQEMPAK